MTDQKPVQTQGDLASGFAAIAIIFAIVCGIVGYMIGSLPGMVYGGIAGFIIGMVIVGYAMFKVS